ncbi:MAG: hypothetical protein ABIJ56_01160 [Pseudomonadota bacterium]
MPMKKHILSILAITTIASAAYGCSGCEEKDDEKAILKLIENGILLAEQHKAGKVMDLATDNFTAMPGNKSTEETNNMLVYAFMRYGKFRIKCPEPKIDITSMDTAHVKIPFIVLREGGLIPDLSKLASDPEQWVSEAGKTADPYYLELWLVKTGDGWRVDKARIDGIRPLEEI